MWTFVFTKMGKSKLREKGILIDKENEQDFLKNETAAANADNQKKNEIMSEIASPERNIDTNPQTIAFDVAPKRKEKSENANVSAAKIKPVDQKCDHPLEVRFCRKCGFKLIEGSNFCSCRGVEIKKR